MITVQFVIAAFETTVTCDLHIHVFAFLPQIRFADGSIPLICGDTVIIKGPHLATRPSVQPVSVLSCV